MKKNTVENSNMFRKVLSIFIISSFLLIDIAKCGNCLGSSSFYDDFADEHQGKSRNRSIKKSKNIEKDISIDQGDESEEDNFSSIPLPSDEITFSFDDPQIVPSGTALTEILDTTSRHRASVQEADELTTLITKDQQKSIVQGLWELLFQDKTDDRIYSVQKNISKVISAIFAVLGSSVIAYESYDFATHVLHAGVAGGIIISDLTFFSPILGYYRINLPYYEQFIVKNNFRKAFCGYCKPISNIFEESLMFIMNFLTSIPLAYASDTDLSKVYGTVIALIIDIPTLISMHCIYDFTTREFVSKTKEIIYKRKLKDVTIDSELDQFSLIRQWLFLHFKKLENFYRTLPGERIDLIHSQTFGLDYREIDNYNRNKILSLISPLDLNERNQERETGSRDIIKKVIGVLGGVIGLGGAYYFAPMATTAFESIFNYFGATGKAAHVIAETLGWLTLGTRGIFSIITGKSTFENMYTFFKNVCCCNQNRKSIVREIIIPAGIIVLAAARATPNMEFSLDYIENKAVVIPLSICAGLTTFSASFWALKAFTDKIFRSNVQVKRDDILNYLKEVSNAMPYMTFDRVNEMFLFINRSNREDEYEEITN